MPRRELRPRSSPCRKPRAAMLAFRVTAMKARVKDGHIVVDEPGRDDLVLARARVLADAIHARTGVIAVAEMLGPAPATTHPAPCVRSGTLAERRSVERFADLALLRCSGDRP